MKSEDVAVVSVEPTKFPSVLFLLQVYELMKNGGKMWARSLVGL